MRKGMRKGWRVASLLALLLVAQSSALAWHDTGHMLIAQIAYVNLSPAAKARVDKLLVAPQGRRPLIHLCATYYTPACDKIYDPVTIAVWMDDFKGDSLNDEYENWHYINYRPFFDGIPARPEVGPEPTNILDRINWCINTLRKGTGRDKTDAETLGFLYHLIGDVHQPLHTITRYTAKNPDGDAGGNGFAVQMPPEARIRNLHSFWDAAGGRFGFESPRRPLDAAARARLVAQAEEIMKANPAVSLAAARDLEPLRWIEESNTIGRQVVYAKMREGEAPSSAYTQEAQRISGERIALAGYRLANLLNSLFVEKATPAGGVPAAAAPSPKN
ncbi:MAG TPA: S1/P1 nuclease [Pyrinomonadaceae bacterium]|nr:S1/P1 nuclease [Pyrinomonadaceae bacterium]